MAELKRRLENLERFYLPPSPAPRHMSDAELEAEIARLLLAGTEPEPEGAT